MSFLRHTDEATGRISFQKVPPVMELPNLIELQRASYERFLNEGMAAAFADISPISDFTGAAELTFEGHELGEPSHDVDECRDKDVTYARPLKVNVSLVIKDADKNPEERKQTIFMGEFPAMTDRGTFVINGAERVIVSQLVRSPGIYFTKTPDPATGKNTFSATVIPNRGAWLEFESDIADILYVRIDKARKLTASILLRALGYSSNDSIRELFDGDPAIEPTLEKDSTKDAEIGGEEAINEALQEIYKKQRPGDPPTPESAKQLLDNLFFEPKRYDLARVGSYRLARKLGHKIACKSCGSLQMPDAIICTNCGKRIVYSTVLEKADIVAAVRYMLALIKADRYLQTDDKSIITEGLKMEADNDSDNVFLKAQDDEHFDILVNDDDIDHLGNRRIRGVGELLQNQFRVGLLRLERVVRERMSVQDVDVVTPANLINIRPVVAAIKEFFGSSQLSQFMDQTNMLAELTHKRRLSALGPGGLSRERAGFEVRDVHYSHYGRICPIETPEGPNIGLIGSLATYGRINDFGFIQAPYRKVVRVLTQEVKDGRKTYKKGEFIDKQLRKELLDKKLDVPVIVHVTSEIPYLSADEEDKYVICQANTRLDERSNIVDKRVVVRRKNETLIVPCEDVDYMDVTPKQIVSVATALIPFLEHDDANRALMGANMQRQAVPLLSPQAPIVGTGMEYRAAKDSGALIVAKEDGVVTSVSATHVTVTPDNGEPPHEYRLQKFKRSNAGTCINQRPAVVRGQRVSVKDVLADGASSVNGELALGRNVLVAFMPWEGYNYEDAILLSEEMVREDVFTSIHIEEYECESRDTKLGPEEITRDIPSVGEDALKDLDEDGVVRIGADVRTEDILVGKVTPKGETELTAEERLLRAIFGEKARDVRDTSLKVPHGERGKVIDVKRFTRENTDELKPGVNQLVRVYVAQKRKILQGDKMAGRHGNKGVISRVMPVEDMPFLPDGTPVQIVLNPLGVPSRMNIGQILETHLGLAMDMMSEPGSPRFRVEVPVFDSASEEEIVDMMSMARLQKDLRSKGVYLSTDEISYVLEEPSKVKRLQDFVRQNTGEDVDVAKAQVALATYASNKSRREAIRTMLDRIVSSGSLGEGDSGSSKADARKKLILEAVADSKRAAINAIFAKLERGHKLTVDDAEEIKAAIPEDRLADRVKALLPKTFKFDSEAFTLALKDKTPSLEKLLELIKYFTSGVFTTAEVESYLNTFAEDDLGQVIYDKLSERNVNVSKFDLSQFSEMIKDKSLEERLSQTLKTHRRHFTSEDIADLAKFIVAYRNHVGVDGKTILFDGRTGEPYDTRITVGQIYMLKLAHLVDDKIHARSTGPYSLITQQPLGGKAQFGGQRFGEMEVWALEAYGAAYTLQELLTVKSDDVYGRVKAYEAIVKGENVLEPGVPESFKVLLKELQSLALDVRIIGADETGRTTEIEIRSVEEQDTPRSGAARELMGISDDALS